jgi:hypothetical protein
MGALAGAVTLAAAAAPAPPISPAQISSAPISPAQVFAARDLVLASPEFNVTPDWTSRFLDWFVAALEGAGAWLPAGIRIYTLLLVLLALVTLAWWLLPKFSADDGAIALRPGDAAGARPGNFDAHLAAATTALAEGRLADCVRAVWNGAVLLLERAGVSRGSSTRADWEHVEAARRQRADLEAPLVTLVTAFQRSHFGAAAVAPAEAQECIELLTRLERTLGGHGEVKL